VFQLLINTFDLLMKSDQDDIEITRLTNRLRALTVEAAARTAEANALAGVICELQRQRQSPTRRLARGGETIVTGDTVRITNNYKGQRGTIGVVTHATRARVTLLDGYGILHTRARNNVSRIDSTS
jgi:hypothetical protein